MKIGKIRDDYTKEWTCVCKQKNPIRDRTCSGCGQIMPYTVEQRIFREELKRLAGETRKKKTENIAGKIQAIQEPLFKRIFYAMWALFVVAVAMLAISVIADKERLSIPRDLLEQPKAIAQNTKENAIDYWTELKDTMSMSSENGSRFTDRMIAIGEDVIDRLSWEERSDVVINRGKERVMQDDLAEAVGTRTDGAVQIFKDIIDNVKRNSIGVKDKIIGRVNDIVKGD